MRLNNTTSHALRGNLFNKGVMNLSNTNLGQNKATGKSNANKKSISAGSLNPLLTGKKVTSKKGKKTQKSSLAEMLKKADKEKKANKSKSKSTKKSAKKLMTEMMKKSTEKQKLQNLLKQSKIQETVGALAVSNHEKNIAKYVKV